MKKTCDTCKWGRVAMNPYSSHYSKIYCRKNGKSCLSIDDDYETIWNFWTPIENNEKEKMVKKFDKLKSITSETQFDFLGQVKSIRLELNLEKDMDLLKIILKTIKDRK